jgi:uncharacterized membrane protein YvbJ
MKRILLLLALFLAFALPTMAGFCTNCGANLPDDAKFCSECGKKQVKEQVESAVENTDKSKLEQIKEKFRQKKEKAPEIEVFRAKTDIYLYEKRGDEKDVLKKNLFFKPRRYRMKRNSSFKILEVVGQSYLLQSIPDKEGRTLQGWVTEEQLALRSNWTKKD